MNTKKLKWLFLICFILLIVILKLSSNNGKIEDNEERALKLSSLTVLESNTNKDKKIDYNHLTDEEKNEYLDIYGNAVSITDRGIEVYNESISPDKLQRIITSQWPEEEKVASYLPKVDFGTLGKIEYAYTWMKVYLQDASKSDYRKYMKELKQMGYTKEIDSLETSKLIRTDITNQEGAKVRVILFKETEKMEISVEI